MNKKIIVISAVWCPYCLILKKYLKKLKEENNELIVNTYDYDFDEDEIKKYNVNEILPVIIVEDNDVEVSRLIGEKTYEEIMDFLKENNAIWRKE